MSLASLNFLKSGHAPVYINRVILNLILNINAISYTGRTTLQVLRLCYIKSAPAGCLYLTETDVGNCEMEL